VRADDAPEPEDLSTLIARGVELRKRGDDLAALDVFRRAYALDPAARVLAQIALAEQALGRWDDAEADLVRALAQANDEWINRNRRDLADSLSAIQGHLAWLDVDSDAIGAEVTVDGVHRGVTPLPQPLRISAGERLVALRTPSGRTVRRTVNAKAGVHAAIVLVFADEVLPSAFASAPPRGETPPVRAPAPDSRASFDTGRVAWGFLGGAAVFALGGAAGLVVREREVSSYNDAACAPAGGRSRYQICGGYRDIGSAAGTMAIVSFAGAGVSVAVGASILAIMGAAARARPRAAAVRCAFAGAGVACGGNF
jgi:hypothetical protein